jgi:hypothetical protein
MYRLIVCVWRKLQVPTDTKLVENPFDAPSGAMTTSLQQISRQTTFHYRLCPFDVQCPNAKSLITKHT